jgi:hypothetical protein
MSAFVVVLVVSFVLGWCLARWWVAPLVYLSVALALAVFDPAAGQNDMAPEAYVLLGPIVPALVAAVATVIGMGTRPRRARGVRDS